MPLDTTCKHVLETMQNPYATVELTTPSTLPKELERIREPESIVSVNLFGEWNAVLATIEVVDLEEDPKVRHRPQVKKSPTVIEVRSLLKSR